MMRVAIGLGRFYLRQPGNFILNHAQAVDDCSIRKIGPLCLDAVIVLYRLLNVFRA